VPLARAIANIDLPASVISMPSIAVLLKAYKTLDEQVDTAIKHKVLGSLFPAELVEDGQEIHRRYVGFFPFGEWL
jgi:hypothetical protein